MAMGRFPPPLGCPPFGCVDAAPQQLGGRLALITGIQGINLQALVGNLQLAGQSR